MVQRTSKCYPYDNYWYGSNHCFLISDFRENKKFIQKRGRKMKSYALIIMKPDALEAELVENIINRFKEHDFQIEMVGFKKADETLILAHYEEVIEKLGPSFKTIMVSDLLDKGLLPVILSQNGQDAIVNARILTGATDPQKALPGTIRGDFGQDSMEAANQEGRNCHNLIHCSDSNESFKKEIKLWFSNVVFETYFENKL